MPTFLLANLHICLLTIAGVSAVMLILSVKRSINNNDGMTIWRLLTHYDTILLNFLRLRFASALTLGERPRTWPKAAIDTILSQQKSIVQQAPSFPTCLLAYAWALDCLHIAEATECLDTYLKVPGKELTPMTPLALEVTFFRAYHQHDATQARTYLGENKEDVDMILLARALAAIAYEEGDLVSAAMQAGKGLHAWQQLRPWKRRQYCMEEEDLRDLLHKSSGNGNNKA